MTHAYQRRLIAIWSKYEAGGLTVATFLDAAAYSAPEKLNEKENKMEASPAKFLGLQAPFW